MDVAQLGIIHHLGECSVSGEPILVVAAIATAHHAPGVGEDVYALAAGLFPGDEVAVSGTRTGGSEVSARCLHGTNGGQSSAGGDGAVAEVWITVVVGAVV